METTREWICSKKLEEDAGKKVKKIAIVTGQDDYSSQPGQYRPERYWLNPLVGRPLLWGTQVVLN